MKVGLSYSRCVADIVTGKVDIDDVLVVVARTDFDPNVADQWASIWNGYYARGEWYGLTEADALSVTLELWNTGKLHQPRKFGAYPNRRPEFWLETVLVEGDLEDNPMAKAAFDKFKTVAGLSNVSLDESYK
jgi:hypothetical protein